MIATRELRGYGIVQAAEDAFAGHPPLDIGSLYCIIARMREAACRVCHAPRRSAAAPGA